MEFLDRIITVMMFISLFLIIFCAVTGADTYFFFI